MHIIYHMYSAMYHVPTIGEIILDGLFPRLLKTLLQGVWLIAVPHERSCSGGWCVYLEPRKLVEVFTKIQIPWLFLLSAHFSILVYRWWFQTSFVVHPSLRKANDNLTLPPAECIHASTKQVRYAVWRFLTILRSTELPVQFLPVIQVTSECWKKWFTFDQLGEAILLPGWQHFLGVIVAVVQ